MQTLTGLWVSHGKLGKQQRCSDPFGDCGNLSVLGGRLLYRLHEQGQKVQGLQECVTCGDRSILETTWSTEVMWLFEKTLSTQVWTGWNPSVNFLSISKNQRRNLGFKLYSHKKIKEKKNKERKKIKDKTILLIWSSAALPQDKETERQSRTTTNYKPSHSNMVFFPQQDNL